MPSLRRPDAERERRALELRSLYEPVSKPPRPRIKAAPVELSVVVKNTLFDRLSIGFELDGAFAGEEPYIVRGLATPLGALASAAGPRRLGVRIAGAGVLFHFDGEVFIPAEGGELVVDVWSQTYPPHLTLGDDWINAPPGRRWRPRSGAPCPTAGDLPLDIVNRDETLEGLLAGRAERPLDLWIDGSRIYRTNRLTVDFTKLILHRAHLSPGLHHVRIGDPEARALILDTDVVLDGFSAAAIEIAGRSHVRLRAGGETVLEQDSRQRPFNQGAVLTDELPEIGREVEGIPIPPGMEGYIDEAEKEAEYLRAMAKNYATFKARKEEVNAKKAAGQPLTPDDQTIDAIDTYDKLQELIKAKKKAEYGWILDTEATTDENGERRYLGPTPTDPMGELRKRETMDIHEPSHVVDIDLLALFFDIDRKKLKRLEDLKKARHEAMLKHIEELEKALKDGTKPPPPPDFDFLPTPEEEALEDWYKANKKKIDDFYKKMDDPMWGATGEIREYEAEAAFWDAVIAWLKSKSYGWIVGDLAINIPVGDTRPIKVEQVPNAPPRVRVIEGEAHVDVSPTERTASNTLSGEFVIKVKGKTKGQVKIELTCGTLRKVVVVNVI